MTLSAYKIGQSTETVLKCIQNDVACELDRGRGVILVHLDLSAAFYTLDYEILHDRMQNRIGINSTALDWFDSYYIERSQRVVIHQSTSQSVILKFGGTQGFPNQSRRLQDLYVFGRGIVRKHNLQFKIYADNLMYPLLSRIKVT